MAELLSYRLGSFLLFSESTYQRLVANLNADLWPLQGLVLVGMLALLWANGLLRWPSRRNEPKGPNATTQATHEPASDVAAITNPWRHRCLWAALALAWAASAGYFLIQRFAAINWAAEYLAWAMALQALAWCVAAFLPQRMGFGRRAGPDPTDPAPDPWGLLLVAIGLLLYPLISADWGQDWSQAHSLGLLPEPTAITSLGLLLLARRPPWWLWPVPLLVCLWSGLWLWALEAPAAWLAPAAAVLALGRAGSSWFRRTRKPLPAARAKPSTDR